MHIHRSQPRTIRSESLQRELRKSAALFSLCAESSPVSCLNFQSLARYASVLFSSVAQSCPTLCDPMDHSTPGFPVYHQLLELTQAHVHRVGDAIQPSVSSSFVPFSFCLQSFPTSGSFLRSQFFTSGGQSIGVSVFQFQHQSFQ